MKKYIFLAFSFLISLSGNAQTIRASIGAGSAANKIKIYLKSDIALAPANISTLQFNLAIPAAVSPKPTATVLTNSLAATWIVETATEAGFYHYLIQTANSPLNPTFTTAEFEAMEIEFSENYNASGAALITLPDGGVTANGKALFLCTGSNINSNGSSLYYNRAGVIATNAFSYDITGGTSGTTISTVVFGSLPVNFLSFYAIKSGDDAKLTWTVENDIDNAYFEIQRSIDGRTYKSVAKVNALNNGRSSNTYETADIALSSLGSQAIYYRIKQVDNSGSIIYSSIRNLNLTLSLDAVNLYPNPAKTITKLVWDVQIPGKGTITIRDGIGRQVQTISMELVKGVNQKDINVSALPSGEYTVTLIGSNTKQTIKLSKIN